MKPETKLKIWWWFGKHIQTIWSLLCLVFLILVLLEYIIRYF